MKKFKNKIGIWSFIGGLVIAVIISLIGAANAPAWAFLLVALLGIIVGLLNITDEESRGYLIASIAFLMSFQTLASVISALAFNWLGISTFFELMSVFVAPGAAIVAVKALFAIARD
ncbi:MAG TPA: hypothetical protein VJB89_00585 [Candidatus Nanoarchaeia archaeon]|nr:hypothetical protein [Candidatus Nanoarchaeia archaeon]